jgi:hypothetical protein
MLHRSCYPPSTGDHENQIESNQNHQHGSGTIEVATNEGFIDYVGDDDAASRSQQCNATEKSFAAWTKIQSQPFKKAGTTLAL